MLIGPQVAIVSYVKRNRRNPSPTGTGWIFRRRFECQPPCTSWSGVSATAS